jgi:superfamily II DNA/RNA helicase
MSLIKKIKSLFTKTKKHLEFRETSEEKKKKQSKANGFAELGLTSALIEKLTQNNFTIPTEVQKKAIPIALNGKNIFCSSETGSGKTLAFLLPMINKFYCNEIYQALILCPTREIALQTQKILKGFGDETLTSALVIGGTNIELQKKALREHPKILVATPGRLLDMLGTGNIWLNYTGYVVLDEADRMLDMGFEEDLMKIHEHFSDKLQMVLFSATLFPEIKKMAKRYADNYEEITVGNPTSVASSVEHIVVKMDPDEKFNALKYLIRGNPCKTIVFFNTIKETTNVANRLKRQRFSNVDYIHSKIDQPGRESIINDFRAEKIKVLLASDVAARGIDIPNVEMVVNYDIPHNSEDYIHRVGRTGRAGKEGTAISFYSRTEKKKLDAIEKLIGVKIKRVAK